MATRINTKFVITLVSVIVLLVLSLVLAFTYLTKNAEDHARIADEAMEKAEVALAKGDVKLGNSELTRAIKHYGNAKNEDPGSIEYLYGMVGAQKKRISVTLTAANNQLDSIISTTMAIHDTPGNADKDREQLYKTLHEYIRMRLFVGNQNPLTNLYGATTKRLDVAPDDAVAKRYLAISMSYGAEQKTDEEEVAEDIQTLTDVAKADPDNPWLQAAVARYYMGNARRLLRAEGNQFSDAVNDNYALSLQYASTAIEKSNDNMPAFVAASAIITDLRTNDEALTAQIVDKRKAVSKALSTKLKDKANREALFIEELGTAITIIRQSRLDPKDPDNTINGAAVAMSLAKLIVEDRPNVASAYQLLGSLQRDRNMFKEAEKTADAGLAVKRNATAVQFIKDNIARLQIQSLLADIKCTLAIQTSDADKRADLLKNASALVDEMADADTLEGQWREARVDFLRGRIALIGNEPRVAVSYLERANRAYNSRDAMTLRLLAQTHARLGTDKLVAGYYETIVSTLRPSNEDILNLINIYVAPGDDQQLEKAQTLLTAYRKQLPNDVRAVRIQAKMLADQKKYDEAIELLQEQDLEKHTDLMDMIAGIQALTGDRDGALNLLRKRIADRAEGEAMNLSLVLRLLNSLTNVEEKRAELDRLTKDGLDPKFAEVFIRMLESGKVGMEDELAMVDIQDLGEADSAMQKFLILRRWNQADEAKAYLDQAIKLDPNRADVIEWRYRLAISEQRWSDANEAITDMLKLSAGDRSPIAVADGQFMRAQVLASQASVIEQGETRTKRFREAIVAYNNALDQYSHYVDGWVQLARLHYTQGNYFAAQDSLLEALNRQSRNVDALELMGLSEQASGDPINALERYEQVLAIRPNHPTALERFTGLAQQLGLTERAIQLREQIRERAPQNLNNRRVLALLYSNNASHEKAKQTIQGVIDTEGKTLQNIVVLSQILGTSEKHDEAINVVQAYLDERGEETTWNDMLLLAQAYERAGKTEDTDAAIARAIELEKSDGTFSASLAKAQTLLSRGKPAEAATLYEQLVKAFPDSDDLKRQAAELYLRLNEFDKCETLANQLPATADRFRLLIQSASRQQGKLGIAVKRAEQAVKAYPSDFGFRLNLIELKQAQQDRVAAGERDYTKLYTLAKDLAKEHSDRVEAKVVLANILLRMDRIAEATKVLEDALEFAPRHPAANERMFSVKLAEARQLNAINPDASQEKAREALAIIAVLMENRQANAALLRSAGQAAELAGITAVAVDYYQQAFEASNTAQDLAAYAGSLLAAGQGDKARSALEGDNATLVSNNLFLRALRGRAIAATGDAQLAANLFGNLLKQSEEPSQQMMIVRQVIATFGREPGRTISIIEGALGEKLSAEIDLALANLLMGRRMFKAAADRLAKYSDQPAADTATQFSILTQLALALHESDQLVKAKAAYEIVFEKLKNNKDIIPQRQQVQMLNNMAYLLADQLQGYEKDAVRYAKQALAMLSDNVSDREYALIQDTLGWAHYKAGELDDAIRELKSSVQKYPLAANQLHLGRAYLAKGDQAHKDLALLVLEDAVKQAKADGDEKMIAETQKWYRESL